MNDPAPPSASTLTALVAAAAGEAGTLHAERARAVLEAVVMQYAVLGAILWVGASPEPEPRLRPFAAWFQSSEAGVLAEGELPYSGSVAGEAFDTRRTQLAAAASTPFPERRAVFAALGVRTIAVVPIGTPPARVAIAFYLAAQGALAADMAEQLDAWASQAARGATTPPTAAGPRSR